jgi:hypothetical protein
MGPPMGAPKNHARSSTVGLNEEPERHVLMRGVVYAYAHKAPYVKSGQSVHGAVEVDLATNFMRCHECGSWWRGLGQHIHHAHNMTARQYKINHGLRMATSLASSFARATASAGGINLNAQLSQDEAGRRLRKMQAGLRVYRAKSGRFEVSHHENRNQRGICMAQILDKINKMDALLGRTPRSGELWRGVGDVKGFNVFSAKKLFNVARFSDLVGLAGLMPSPSIQGRRQPKYSHDLLIEILRDFYAANGRTPYTSEFQSGVVPVKSVFYHWFGSLEHAYECAGVSKSKRKQTPSPTLGKRSFSRDGLLSILRAFYTNHGRRPLKREFASVDIPHDRKTFIRYFGSLKNAHAEAESSVRAAA